MSLLLKLSTCFLWLVISILSISRKSFGREGERFKKDPIANRGKQLVIEAGCNVCHSPKIRTTEGQIVDKDKLFSGHPEYLIHPEIPPGKIKGTGRNLLPPMPLHDYNRLSVDDLKAIFVYLMALKPIKNRVHPSITSDTNKGN